MKRVVFFLGIVGIFCWIGFSIIGCDNGSSPSTGEYDATRPIVCLGDSLTAGYINGIDGSVYLDKSWPAHLQKKVTVEVINAGVSGDTTTDALSRMEGDVLSKNPQIVIIALGGNDLSVITSIGNFGSVLNSMSENLQAIINRVKATNRKLYLVNYLSQEMINGVAEYAEAEITLSKEQRIYIYNSVAGIYTTLAEFNNIELIEDMITAEMYASYMSDPIHLDETGYEKASEIIFT
jgi:acyl-CoA thioesterase-1